MSRPEIVDYIKIDEDTYQIDINWYEPESQKPTDPNAVYYQDGNDYMVAYLFEKMIFKYHEDRWIVSSYSKR